MFSVTSAALDIRWRFTQQLSSVEFGCIRHPLRATEAGYTSTREYRVPFEWLAGRWTSTGGDVAERPLRGWNSSAPGPTARLTQVIARERRGVCLRPEFGGRAYLRAKKMPRAWGVRSGGVRV